MACEKFKQYAIVRSDSAETFENKLNARMYELRNEAPEVLFNEHGQTLTATIEYTVTKDLGTVERDPVTDGMLHGFPDLLRNGGARICLTESEQ